MSKTYTKLLSLLIAAVLLFSVCPVYALASENVLPADNFFSSGKQPDNADEDLKNTSSENTSVEQSNSLNVNKEQPTGNSDETPVFLPEDCLFYDDSPTKTTSLELRREDSGEYTLYVPVEALVDTQHTLRIVAPADYTEELSLTYTRYKWGSTAEGSEDTAQSEYGVLVTGAYSTGTSPLADATHLMYSTKAKIYLDGVEYNLAIKPYCSIYALNITETGISNKSYRPQTRPYKEDGFSGFYTTTYVDSTIEIMPVLNAGVLNSLSASVTVDGTPTVGTFVNTQAGTTSEVSITVSCDEKWGIESRTYTLKIETVNEDFFPILKYKEQLAGNIIRLGNVDLNSDIDVTIDCSTEAAECKWSHNKSVVGNTNTVKIDTSNPANAMQNKYTFEASNVVNGLTYTSKVIAMVGVNGDRLKEPAIISQPISAIYQTGDKAIPLTVEAAGAVGGKLIYTWYKNSENNLVGATELENSSKNQYELTTDTGSIGTTYYFCVIKDTYKSGKTTIESAPVTTAIVTVEVVGAMPSGVTGSGTEDDPYLLSTAEQLSGLQELVNSGKPFHNTYFKLTDDIVLPNDWQPLGSLKDGTTSTELGININPFSGIIDGADHKISIPEGGLPLIGYARDATVKNLNIYGKKIAGYGLVNNYTVDYGDNGNYNIGDVPETIRIENCRLLKGTSTLKAGFIGGYASGKNYVYVIGCTVEEGVTIGYSHAENYIGSIGGQFNGMIMNCTSAATVYGARYVGGLVGNKGQSMGLFQIQNSSFTGTVEATGEYAGGILGAGYNASSAPNSPLATIRNCFVSGNVIGADKVGGITGGEPGVVQAWGNGEGDLVDNVFYGKISATGEGKYVGVIVGYMRSLNRYNIIANNYFSEECGTNKGIGFVAIVDTHAEHKSDSETQYVNTSVAIPDIEGFSKHEGDYSRADDPLGKDADKLAKAVTTEKLTDGTLVSLLNGSSSSFKNWVDGTNGPILSDEPVAYALAVTGDYQTTYTLGDALDLTGIVLTAKWSDGTAAEVDVRDITVTGFDTNTRGQQTVTLTYGAAKATINVTVLQPAGEDIKVIFSLLGDSIHDENGGSHTLADGNLEKWIDSVTITVSNNATVLDVITQALGDKYIIENPNGNYISAITPKDGKRLAEFTNGEASGWMFTINGVHGDLGVAQQYLNDGDVIVLHYTDDYIREYACDQEQQKKTADEVIAMIDAIGFIDLTKGEVISAARNAYDKLTDAEKVLVTNYQALLDAEAAYAKLLSELGAKVEEIYKITGDFIASKGTPGTGSIGGEWAALGLARSGRIVPAGYYDAVLKFVQENIDENGRLDRSKSTENSRIILALTAIGKDVTNVDGYNLLKGLDSMSFIKKQSVNGPVFALIALDSHNYPTSGDVTRDKLLDAILATQCSDGSWPVIASSKIADIDMTAMAVQALAPYYSTNDKVKAAVDSAAAFLASAQNADGTFSENVGGTSSSESTAQVLVMLCALGIDPTMDSRFTKNGVNVLDALCGYYVTGGGFKHISSETTPDGMATEQGYYALAAYFRLKNGQTFLYDMSDVTISNTPVTPVEPGNDKKPAENPSTGDHSQLILWMSTMVISGAAIVLLMQKKKKRAE